MTYGSSGRTLSHHGQHAPPKSWWGTSPQASWWTNVTQPRWWGNVTRPTWWGSTPQARWWANQQRNMTNRYGYNPNLWQTLPRESSVHKHSPPPSGKKYFLTALLTVKDEMFSILEFMQHYIEEGIDHVYIYDDGSKDETVLALKCIDSSFYTVYRYDDLPHDEAKFASNRHNNSGQLDIYNQLYTYAGARRDSEWVMIVDTDEYMTSRAKPSMTVREILESDLAHCGIISVPWILYSWGDRNHTQGNSVRKLLLERWGFDEEYALVNATHGKFMNIDEGVWNKPIVRTDVVSRMNYVHEADFFLESENMLKNGTICVPHINHSLSCVTKAREKQKHLELQQQSQDTSLDQQFDQKQLRRRLVDREGNCTSMTSVLDEAHGRYAVEMFPNTTRYCPLCNTFQGIVSSYKTQIQEVDVDGLLLAIFHYRVKSRQDFIRLCDRNRHSAKYYRPYWGHENYVNRLDVHDDFVVRIRNKVRAQHPDFISAQNEIRKCRMKYFW